NSEVENQIRLGYELTDAYDVVNTTCYVVVGQEKVVVGSHQEKRYRNVTRQVGLVKRDISLEVRGGTLLPSEKEVITFWVSAGKEEVKVMDTHHNNYQYRTRDVSTTSEVISGLTVTRIKTEVLLTAVARARTPARNSMLDGIELMSASDGL